MLCNSLFGGGGGKVGLLGFTCVVFVAPSWTFSAQFLFFGAAGASYASCRSDSIYIYLGPFGLSFAYAYT
jgi:hypothetical protein